MQGQEISKSQKKKLRKLKARSVKSDVIHPPMSCGFKYACSGSRNYFFYRTSTFERIPSSFFITDPIKTENQSYEILIEEISGTNVDVSFSCVVELLSKNCEFEKKARKFIHKFRIINLKALLNFHCPKFSNSPIELEDIFSFLKSIFFKSGLFELFQSNTLALEKCLKKCLTKTKSSVNLVGELMQDFLPCKVSWLKQYPSTIQFNILAKLVCWLIYSFTHLVISSFFHPTDSTHKRHQILFYRKSSWQSMTSKTLSTLLKSGRLHSLASGSKAKVISCSMAPNTVNLRFIPKRDMTKVRPITMKYKTTKFDPSLVALTKQFAGQYPAKSDLSGQTLHREWSRIVLELGLGKMLYWVTADVTDAFGSIKLPKLCCILKILASKSLLNVKEKTGELCKRLLLHTANYKLGGVRKTFLVTQGVLQGDPLSSNLSDIYYGDMILHCLSDFVSAPIGAVEILLRGADDFLFVSTNFGRVKQFLELIRSGFASHNCYFKPDKTLTNVDTLDQNLPIPFCGALLHIKPREISPNYASYAGSNIYYSQKGPNQGVRPGAFISSRFVFFCKIRQTSLYFGQYNSRDRLLTTLAANVSLALRRLTCMLDCLIWSRGRTVQEKWLWEVLMVGFRRFRGSCAKASINPVLVKWIALSCLGSELKRSSQFSKKIRNGVKNALFRIKISEEKRSYLTNIVTNAHVEISYVDIHAKAGFKYLSY